MQWVLSYWAVWCVCQMASTQRDTDVSCHTGILHGVMGRSVLDSFAMGGDVVLQVGIKGCAF